MAKKRMVPRAEPVDEALEAWAAGDVELLETGEDLGIQRSDYERWRRARTDPPPRAKGQRS